MMQSWNLREVHDVSGLIEISDRRNSISPACVALDDAGRQKYESLKGKEIWQHVALHSGVDPDWWSDIGGFRGFMRLADKRRSRRLMAGWFDLPTDEPTSEDRLHMNLIFATQAARRGEIRPAWNSSESEPLLALARNEVFSEWAIEVQLPVIGPWLTRTGIARLRRREAPDTKFVRAGDLLELPCITQLERALQATAWHFETERLRHGDGWFPANREMSDWAMANLKVTRNMGDAIATMIRGDWKKDAPTAALVKARQEEALAGTNG